MWNLLKGKYKDTRTTSLPSLLLSLLLTLNIFHFFFYSLYCWICTGKCLLVCACKTILFYFRFRKYLIHKDGCQSNRCLFFLYIFCYCHMLYITTKRVCRSWIDYTEYFLIIPWKWAYWFCWLPSKKDFSYSPGALLAALR